MSEGYVGYNADKAMADLRVQLTQEVLELTELVYETARSNVRYYPEVKDLIRRKINFLADMTISGEITSDHWQAFLEQFGKGSLMAGPDENPFLVTYMNSEKWNRLRSRNSRVVLGRSRGNYKSIDGSVRYSGGSYAGVDLEELAERGDIDKKFGATPPTFFMRRALQFNRNRILNSLQHVIDTFPYHLYFRMR